MITFLILLALICALTTNLGFFYKHRGACAAEPVDIKHPLHSAKSLWSSGVSLESRIPKPADTKGAM